MKHQDCQNTEKMTHEKFKLQHGAHALHINAVWMK